MSHPAQLRSRSASRSGAAGLATLLLASAVLAGTAFAQAPATRASAVAPGRLGRDVDPVAQRVFLRLDPREPGYTGSVRITIEAKKPFGEVVLHAEGLTVETIHLAGGTVQMTPKWAAEEPG